MTIFILFASVVFLWTALSIPIALLLASAIDVCMRRDNERNTR